MIVRRNTRRIICRYVYFGGNRIGILRNGRIEHTRLTGNHNLLARVSRCVNCPSNVGGLFKRFSVDFRRNIAALIALQFFYYVLNSFFVKIRQVQFDVIQKLITLHTHLQGRSNHSTEQLCDIGGIIADSKGHHRFCSGAIPAR